MSDRDKALLATLKAILEVCEEVVPSADIRLIRAKEAFKDLDSAIDPKGRCMRCGRPTSRWVTVGHVCEDCAIGVGDLAVVSGL